MLVSCVMSAQLPPTCCAPPSAKVTVFIWLNQVRTVLSVSAASSPLFSRGSLSSGRIIERISETRDADAGAEVDLMVQQRLAALSISSEAEWA
jgi:hypothetical protein